jgi:hypothetical protein
MYNLFSFIDRIKKMENLFHLHKASMTHHIKGAFMYDSMGYFWLNGWSHYLCLLSRIQVNPCMHLIT